MISDAHVHMGYYSRKGFREPFYYSPRRVLGVLDRCGVDEFIVSSTCAQVASISICDLNREAREMKRLAGARAHVFLWVSGRMMDEDRQLKVLDEPWRRLRGDGSAFLYEGIKLHEMETPWVKERKCDLERVLSIANERRLPVQFHSGPNEFCSPRVLAKFAQEFPSVRFDFAHCRPMGEMAEVVGACPNVWTDTAFMDASEQRELPHYDWHGRLMFGSDLPVWQAHEDAPLTKTLRARLAAFCASGLEREPDLAFARFVQNQVLNLHKANLVRKAL